MGFFEILTLMEQEYQEVDFNQYCKTCKHEKLSVFGFDRVRRKIVIVKESAEPCDDCLSHPTKLYSAKPVHWEEK